VNEPAAPKDLASWHWGRFNAVDVEHPVLGKIPINSTLVATGSERAVWKRIHSESRNASPRAFRALHREPGGLRPIYVEHGDRPGRNFLSPYYMDQWNAWYEGTTFALPSLHKR